MPCNLIGASRLEAHESRLRELYAAGVTRAGEMGLKLGVQAETARGWMVKLGLEPAAAPGDALRGVTMAERKAAGEAKAERARAMRADGATLRQIEAALKVGRTQLKVYLREPTRRAAKVAGEVVADRRCLCCAKMFTPPGRFRFRCDRCLDLAEGVEANEHLVFGGVL